MPPSPPLTNQKSRSLNGLPEGSAPLSTGRVLVVDDESGNRILMTDWLSSYGHQVTTAGSGSEALRAVEQVAPDAIVLDVKMPGMDGFTVCEKLKGDSRTAMIPILLLTSLHEREDRLRGMRAGANDFLFKPADLPDVLLRVRNAVRLSHLHAEVEAKLREISRQELLKESLLHMIVHDLRTPLAALDGFLQLLERKPNANTEDRHPYYLQQALRASHKLAQQVDLLLDIHRLEEGHMPVQAVSHDLAQVVDEAVTPLRPLFGDRHLKIECPPQPLTAVGDPGLLGRVVSNLVGNAIAFTSPMDGEIFVRVLPRPGQGPRGSGGQWPGDCDGQPAGYLREILPSEHP